MEWRPGNKHVIFPLVSLVQSVMNLCFQAQGVMTCCWAAIFVFILCLRAIYRQCRTDIVSFYWSKLKMARISSLLWPNPHRTRDATQAQIGTFFLWCYLHAVWTPPLTSTGPICLCCVVRRVPHPVWIGPVFLVAGQRCQQNQFEVLASSQNKCWRGGHCHTLCIDGVQVVLEPTDKSVLARGAV